MATLERDFLESYTPGATIQDVVANFGSSQGYWRIYRYRQPGVDPGEYSHYAVLSERPEEAAMFRSEYVLDPVLVWERPSGRRRLRRPDREGIRLPVAPPDSKSGRGPTPMRSAPAQRSSASLHHSTVFERRSTRGRCRFYNMLATIARWSRACCRWPPVMKPDSAAASSSDKLKKPPATRRPAFPTT